MLTVNQRVTLDTKEVEKTIEEYYNARSTGKYCGHVSITTGNTSKDFRATFDVINPPGVDPTQIVNESFCKLRHKTSGLFLCCVRRYES